MRNAADNGHGVIWIPTQPRRPLCDVPWLGTSVVLSDGNVNFCCFSNAVVGNVNAESFEQIWNGPIMRRIRHSLSEQRLPPECQSTSCPIYRGDELHYLIERMEGPNRSKTTGTHDPHARIRECLRGSELRVTGKEWRAGGTFEVGLEFYYRGEPLITDLFIGIRHPDGIISFLPTFEEYAVPFKSSIELCERPIPLQLEILKQPVERFGTAGVYEICAALFERDSNPNILSNCYWSAKQTISLNFDPL